MASRCDPDPAMGDCRTCGAAVWNGEACRLPFTLEGARRKNLTYERKRAAWRKAHPLGPVDVVERRKPE